MRRFRPGARWRWVACGWDAAVGRGVSVVRDVAAVDALLPAIAMASIAMAAKAVGPPAATALSRGNARSSTCFASGSAAGIATALGTSPNTVRNQIWRLMARLGAGTRAELIARCAPMTAGDASAPLIGPGHRCRKWRHVPKPRFQTAQLLPVADLVLLDPPATKPAGSIRRPRRMALGGIALAYLACFVTAIATGLARSSPNPSPPCRG